MLASTLRVSYSPNTSDRTTLTQNKLTAIVKTSSGSEAFFTGKHNNGIMGLGFDGLAESYCNDGEATSMHARKHLNARAHACMHDVYRREIK